MADEKDDVILNEEDQKLSNPVTETKQAVPSTAQDKLALGNGKFDEKDTDAGDKTEAKGKTETTDNRVNRIRNYTKAKTNQMSDSSKAKTDTTATGKFNNPFQKEKEAADKTVEDALVLLDRVKQSAARGAEKLGDYHYSKDDSFAEKVTKVGKSIKGSFLGADVKESRRELRSLAKDLNVNIDDVSKDVGIESISKTESLLDLAKVHGRLAEIAEERLAAARTKQQEAQANYTKAEEEEAAKRKAEEEAAAKRKAEEEAAKAQKAAESTRKQLTEVTTKEQEAETKTETEAEKDETEDPLKKAEELEQKTYQTPDDIKKFSNDLNRFVIQAYLNGDFGKKSSPNAIATMGFFILDKIGAALVNASEVARGMSPSAKSQWSKILDKQTELLGKRITANWLMSLPKETLTALIRTGEVPGASSQKVYENISDNAVIRAEQRDILEISKLSQEQKGVAQSNVNALLARKSELQTLINQLKSDQGWEAYAQAMNAVVGTAKGLSSLGITDDSSSSSNKGFSDTLSADVKTGKVTAAFVSGGISNKSTWNNSSAESLSKSNSINQDALAISKFKSGEEYAKASREAKKAANEQLIKRLEGQIEIIDKCIDSWGKDLGL